MTEFEYDCYALASEIERVYAKVRAAEQHYSRLPVHLEYDPHTATELGTLIYRRLVNSSKRRIIP